MSSVLKEKGFMGINIATQQLETKTVSNSMSISLVNDSSAGRQTEPAFGARTSVKAQNFCKLVGARSSPCRRLVFGALFVPMCMLFLVLPTNSNAATALGAQPPPGILNINVVQSNQPGGGEASGEDPGNDILALLAPEGNSIPSRKYVSSATTNVLSQQHVPLNTEGATDEVIAPLDLQPYREFSTPVQQRFDEMTGSHGTLVPLSYVRDIQSGEHEGSLTNSVDAEACNRGALNMKRPYEKVDNASWSPEERMLEEAVQKADRCQMDTSGYLTEATEDESLQPPDYRRMQQLDPLLFGPAAQYAQYLATFTPNGQQQQQLQFLQQAIAAGIMGTNPAALKKLQRRAQAAAYANSVTSHPLIQGVLRTAYTALGDALSSVSVADVLQGSLGGAYLLPGAMV